jgi:segregation and condensation protein B
MVDSAQKKPDQVGKAERREHVQEKMTQTQDTQDIQDPQGSQQVSEAEIIAALVTATESLLFVSGRPLEYTELRKLLDINDTRLARVLDTLAYQLESQGRGIRVQRLGSQVQLVTAPENARYIAALLGLPMTAKLTTAAMETLAVISYRQPMTRAQIEAVRGVNSDRALASLLQHGLVSEIGRATTVGRLALFATTPDFLQQFGLTSLTELPCVELPGPESQNGHHKDQNTTTETVQQEISDLEAIGNQAQHAAAEAVQPAMPRLEAMEE